MAERHIPGLYTRMIADNAKLIREKIGIERSPEEVALGERLTEKVSGLLHDPDFQGYQEAFMDISSTLLSRGVISAQQSARLSDEFNSLRDAKKTYLREAERDVQVVIDYPQHFFGPQPETK